MLLNRISTSKLKQIVNMTRNIKTTMATKKPYCKVCFDAGKPESEYTSHWVRSLPDRLGKTTVTCPILLDTECKYCRKLGHTTKYCPAIKRMNKEKEKAITREKLAKAEKSKADSQKQCLQNNKLSTFASLMDSDSETEKPPEKVSEPVNNFPALCAPAKVNTQEHKRNWATVASKTSMPAKPIVRVDRPEAVKKPVITKSWAEWSDSDDDDEEDNDEEDRTKDEDGVYELEDYDPSFDDMLIDVVKFGIKTGQQEAMVGFGKLAWGRETSNNGKKEVSRLFESFVNAH